jgi:PAS domain-containing protein
LRVADALDVQNDPVAQRSHRITLGGDPHPAATVRASIDFASVLEQAPQLVCLLQGPQHTIAFANSALRRAVAEANLVGSSLSTSPLGAWPDLRATVDRVHGDGNPVVLRRVPVTLRFASTSVTEIRLLDLTCQPIRDPLGGISSIMLSGVDVTEQARSEAAGPGSHAHAETILSVIGDGYVSFDSDFRVIRINDAALRFDGRE